MFKILDFLSTEGFQPHGMCLLWRPDVFWTHVISDVVIVLAYFSIPAALMYLAFKRPDLHYRRVLFLFGSFIVACGITHLFGIWTMWVPDYSVEAVFKAIAALISAATAITLWPLMPKLIALPTTALLTQKNEELSGEIRERQSAEQDLRKLNNELERRVRERTEELEKLNSALKESEARIQQERDRLEDSLNAVPTGFVLWESNEQFLFANKAYREMRPDLEELLAQGLSADEFAERAMKQRIQSGGSETLAGYLSNLRRDESEWEYQLGDGRWIRHSRQKTSDGGRVAILTDISDLVETRQSLEDSLEAIPNGFLIWNAGGDLVYVNKRFREFRPELSELFAKEKELNIREFSRRSITARLPNASEEEIEEFTLAPGSPPRTIERRGVDGRWIIRSNSPTSSGGTVIVLTDISDLKNIQGKLEDQAADLQRSNEELEQFAYLASHDLQEPLRVVASYCDLLDQMYSDKLDEQGREFIHYAVDGAKRMRSLIDDLLIYSRAGRGTLNFEEVDLSDTLKDVKLALHQLLSEIEVDIDARDMPVVMGSSALLVQVFQNLLGNAIKFRSEEPPRIEIRATRKDDFWEISVSDNGIGIEPKYADRVFRMFQRLHGRKAYPGNGLGLALCQRIVYSHGGTIWIDSSAEVGTKICLTLPAVGTFFNERSERPIDDGSTTS